MSDINTLINATVANNNFDGMNPHTISITSNLSSLNPEVTKKALENTPELAQTAREVIKSTKEVSEKGLCSNDMSMQYYYENTERSSEFIRKCMEDATEETTKIMLAGILKDLCYLNATKDTENKGFIATETMKNIACGLGAAVLTVGLLGVGIGLGIRIPIPIKIK